jgi:hypothetical protein
MSAPTKPPASPDPPPPGRQPDWTDPEQAEGPETKPDDADAPRGIDTLPRSDQSPGKPDSTEAANQQPAEEQPPRYGNKLV